MNLEILLRDLKENNVGLSVKGNKLLCKLPDEGIDDDLFNSLKTHKEEIIKIIRRKVSFEKYRPIPKALPMPTYPLSAAQSRLWVLSQLDGGSQAYNIVSSGKFIGEFQDVLFEQSFRNLIGRHEILRTSFKTDGETAELQQIIMQEEELVFQIERLDFSSQENITQSIENYQHDLTKEPICLETAPLFRVALIKVAEQEHVFLFVIHHIICDGWSMEILLSEIVQCYNDLVLGKENKPPELGIQYKDYAVWFGEEMQKEKYQHSGQSCRCLIYLVAREDQLFKLLMVIVCTIPFHGHLAIK